MFSRFLDPGFPRLLWLALFLEGIGTGLFTVVFPLLLSDKGFSYSEIGSIMSATSILSPFSSAISGFLTKYFDASILASMGLLLGALTTTLYILISRFEEYMVNAAISSFGFAVFFTTWPILYQRIKGRADAGELALLAFGFNLGGIIGVYVAGLLYSMYGVWSLLLDAALLVLAATVILIARPRSER